MDIEVAGNIIHLQVTPLGDQIDDFLKSLFTKFFSNLHKPYPEFIKECYPDLVRNIHTYLDGKINNFPGQDFLFNNLTIIWKNYQNSGRVGEAQQFWLNILNIIIKWEQSRKTRIHKGSLFYFWSQTAILQGQLDKGFFLIHSAYEEDVLTRKTELPDTPAFKTVSLNYSDKDNYLYDLVEDWANYLDSFVADYQKVSGKKLTLGDFRTKFLSRPPSRDTLFWFTYTLARFYDFDSTPSVLIRGNFASLFEMKTLFDLVLVIDTVIYASISSPGRYDWKFINLANLLLVKSGISPGHTVNRTHMEHINLKRIADFEITLRELLDQTFIYPDGISPSRLECDIAITYCIRNYSAHKLDSFPVIRDRFQAIRQSIFNVLFLATEAL